MASPTSFTSSLPPSSSSPPPRVVTPPSLSVGGWNGGGWGQEWMVREEELQDNLEASILVYAECTRVVWKSNSAYWQQNWSWCGGLGVGGGWGGAARQEGGQS